MTVSGVATEVLDTGRVGCHPLHMNEPTDLLTPGQVVQLLGINRSTLTRWETAGHLVPVRIGSRYVRYRRGDLEAILNAEAS